MPISNLKFTRTGDQVVLEGDAAPHSELEAENLSAAPFGPSTHTDTFTRTRAGADGHFRLPVASGKEGDRIRLRGRTATGVDVTAARVAGIARVDGRRAEVAQQALRLVPRGDEGFSFTSVSKNPRLSEPGTVLRFTNLRTGDAATFVLDDAGLLPADARLAGKAGDTFEIAATDGRINPDLSASWSYLVAPPDLRAGEIFEPPLGHKDAGRPVVPLLQACPGDLFVDGIDADDPLQGALGDCYLVAGVSAIAAVNPDAIASLFEENDDRTVTVRFGSYDRDRGVYVDVPITVTRRLYTRGGQPIYGASSNSTETGKMEVWFPLLEKAYAAWKGGYDAIRGGYACEVFEAILGVEGRHFDPAAMGADAIWSQLCRAVRQGDPVMAWTHPDSTERPFVNSGLVADHGYSVRGVEEEGGKRWVKIRNPWGSRPADGNFKLPLDELVHYFYGVAVARGD